MSDDADEETTGDGDDHLPEPRTDPGDDDRDERLPETRTGDTGQSDEIQRATEEPGGVADDPVGHGDADPDAGREGDLEPTQSTRTVDDAAGVADPDVGSEAERDGADDVPHGAADSADDIDNVDEGDDDSRSSSSPGDSSATPSEDRVAGRPGSGSDTGDFDGPRGDLPPRELDRAFSVLERAFTSDALGGRQLDRLLTVFEEAVVQEEADPEAMAELISLLEELIIEPDDLGMVDVGGILSILEEAISETTRVDREDVADVFDVIEEGFRDPTGIEPDDVERFRVGVENAILDITDPQSSGLGGLFAFPERLAEEVGDPSDDDDAAVDSFRIARIAAAMTQRATGYSMESGIRTGTRMAYAAANAQSPVELLTNTRAIALDELQRAGIDIGDEQQQWLAVHEDELIDARPLTRASLEERGVRLLQESAEIGVDESIHPSFPLVLEQLSSDEARILRLLAIHGPQGVVDVYERTYIPWGLQLISQNMTMLGSDAGCRYKHRTPMYLQNLERLGLVAVRDKQIANPKRYQILEAQPHVEAARDSVKRSKTRYKRVELTDFGIEFCETCFPFSVRTEPSTAGYRSADDE